MSCKRQAAAAAIPLRRRVLAAALAACAQGAFANQGLVASASGWLWPQLQARITLQTAALSPVSLTRLSESGAASRSLQGASLLGDYVIATPGFGSLRATSGVLLGAQSGVPMLSALAGPRLEVTVLDGGFVGAAAETPTTLPYLGLGYSSATLWRSISLSADLGVVAGRHGSLSGLGRAVLGNQNFDSAVRDLRLAPVLQLGVRYSF
ncbi:MAG: hypothetical protein JNJ89_10395 [Rubrivivax sp.]|nr:hypothetical protein [Rubrivivax sp.]